MYGSYVKSDAKLLMLFDNPYQAPPNNSERYFQFDWCNSDFNTNNLHPRPEHIIYCMYVLHCSRCPLPLQACPIPGCGSIRGLCGGISAQPDSNDNSTRGVMDILLSLGDLGGMGTLPIEQACRYFLCSQANFGSLVVPVSPSMNNHHIASEENKSRRMSKSDVIMSGMSLIGLESNQSFDENVITSSRTSIDVRGAVSGLADAPPILGHGMTEDQQTQSKKMSVFPWRQFEQDGLLLRYIHRRVLDAGLSTLISAEDVLEARGGHDQREEVLLDDAVLSQLHATYLPPPLLRNSENSIRYDEGGEIDPVLKDDAQQQSTITNHVAGLGKSVTFNESQMIVEHGVTLAAQGEQVWDNTQELNSRHSIAPETPGISFRIPLDLIRKMHGFSSSSYSGNGQKHCAKKINNLGPNEDSIDPCPPMRSSSIDLDLQTELASPVTDSTPHTPALSRYLYDWIVTHLHIARPINNLPLDILGWKRHLKDIEDQQEDRFAHSSSSASITRLSKIIESRKRAKKRRNGILYTSASLSDSNSDHFLYDAVTGNNQPLSPHDMLLEALMDPLSVVYDETEMELQFDRKYAECLTTLSDQNLIFIQVLYGILKDSSRVTGPVFGCPDATRRHIPQSRLACLSDGLTIHIHDVTSHTSQVVLLEGRSLSLFSAHYHISDTDYPNIARCIISNASNIITLQRINSSLCINASLSIPNNRRERQFKSKKTKEATSRIGPPIASKLPSPLHISRRYALKQSSVRVIAAAKELLSLFSSEDLLDKSMGMLPLESM
jgi:hypothetical protein